MNGEQVFKLKISIEIPIFIDNEELEGLSEVGILDYAEEYGWEIASGFGIKTYAVWSELERV